VTLPKDKQGRSCKDRMDEQQTYLGGISMNNQLEALHQWIREICMEKMNLPAPEQIDETLPVEKAYELDSISMFELIVNLEEKYEVKVPDADVEKVGKMNLTELLMYMEGQKIHG
jgi:acyl carrier protein